MQLVTWNVLHRIHAVNWSEPAIEALPDERARIAAIADRVRDLAADVICLQEVSGDQLAALRAAGHAIYEHTYPRVPKLFRGGSPVLENPTEHLVTIVRRDGARRSHGETYPTDKGKGFLVVELPGLAVINTHVSYGDHHGSQLAQLAAVACGYPAVAILGDFNADRVACADRLGSAFVAGVPQIDAPTRPRAQPSEKSQSIDHVFVAGCAVTSLEVLSGGGLSDHNPVVATVAC